MRSVLIIALICAVFPATIRAADLPALGDSAQVTLTPTQEKLLGESIMREIRKDPDFLNDPALDFYLTNLGYRLVAASPDSRQAFEFFVVRDDALNAFALPGGFIGIHTGLLIGAQSEAELAAVLSHEIAHVTQRHLARMIDKQQSTTMETLAMLVAGALLSRSKNPAYTDAIMRAVPAIAMQKQLDSTRGHEEEADRVGIQILKSAGFDPRAMPAFLERLQKSSRVYDSNNLPDYLRTHPLTVTRVAETQNIADQYPYRQTQDSPDFQYLRASLRAEQGDSAEAVEYFQSQLRDGRYANEFATRFGLVSALVRHRQLNGAQQEMQRLRQAPPHPMLELLQIAIFSRNKDWVPAYQTAKQAVARFPGYFPLKYAALEVALEMKRWTEALADVDLMLSAQPGNSRLHEFRARALSGLGRIIEMHQANGEAQALRGNYPAAIYELTEAHKLSSKLPLTGREFQINSTIEARLRELKTIEKDAKKGKEPSKFAG